MFDKLEILLLKRQRKTRCALPRKSLALLTYNKEHFILIVHIIKDELKKFMTSKHYC
jgi:hypothetical protein